MLLQIYQNVVWRDISRFLSTKEKKKMWMWESNALDQLPVDCFYIFASTLTELGIKKSPEFILKIV